MAQMAYEIQNWEKTLPHVVKVRQGNG